MQQAFENNDPDDILRAKQLASTFIGPVPRPTGRIGATVRSSRLSPCHQKLSYASFRKVLGKRQATGRCAAAARPQHLRRAS